MCLASFKSCVEDMEAGKVTFLSLLNPDSAVGAVCFASAPVWEVLPAQVWTKGGTIISCLLWEAGVCFVN